MQAPRLCDQCQAREARQCCGRCFHVYYCGTECQHRAWREHKPRCFYMDETLCGDANNSLLHEAMRLELFAEYQSLLTARHNGVCGVYDEARYFLYRVAVDLVVCGTASGVVDAAQREEHRGDLRRAQAMMQQYLVDRPWFTHNRHFSDKQAWHWVHVPSRLWPVIDSLCE